LTTFHIDGKSNDCYKCFHLGVKLYIW